MNKELQNKAWSILPKEFKEEVKKLYSRFLFTREGYYNELFGIHNLTSDAEREELLMCEKSKVQEAYKISKDIVNNEQYGTCQYSIHTQIMCVLENLFGQKCLPDEKASISMPLSESKPFKYSVGQKVILHFYGGEVSTITEAFNDRGVWNKYKVKMLPTRVWNENELDPYEEPKSAEPKFKRGDMVIYKPTGKKKIVLDIDEYGRYYVATPNMQSPIYVDESYLEPYTELENG